MERLIIFRHGKAERSSATGQDFDRALTSRGVTDSELAGRRLAADGVIPDVILMSSSARTVQTFEAARAAFPAAEAKALEALYLAGANRLLHAAEAERDAATVMLVGHNPGMHELALRLAVAGETDPADLDRLQAGFPTAAAAVFSFTAGRPRLDAYHTAKELR